MDLHKVTENILALSEENSTLTMDQYKDIIKDEAKELQERLKRLANIIG